MSPGRWRGSEGQQSVREEGRTKKVYRGCVVWGWKKVGGIDEVVTKKKEKKYFL